MEKLSKRLVFCFWFACIVAAVLLVLYYSHSAFAKTAYDLVIHYVYPKVNPSGDAYNVEVFFSVIDEDGKLQKGFEKDDFTLIENGSEKDIESLDKVTNEVLNVVVVMDTSVPSQRLTNEKDAISDFIKDLERDDSIGILRFDSEIETVVDLTTDQDKALDKLKKVKNVSEGDNCLYDAMYKAVKMIAKQPPGRRAIVVLTDAEDRLYNSTKVCSANTDDDVIDLATSWNTRVPIYTLAITDATDEKVLKRIAERTGGRYKFAKNSGDIASQLNDISYQFQNEYILRYTSQQKPGEYTLVLEVEYKSVHDEDTRSIVYSDLLPSNGQSTAVEASPAVPPAETAVSQGEQLQPTEIVALPTPAPKEEPTSFVGGISMWLVILGVVVVIGVIVILLIVAMIRRSGSKKPSKPAAPSAPPPLSSAASMDATFDGFAASPAGMPVTQAVGTLTVLASEDAAMIGKVLMVGAGRTTIGRSPDNDIVLPQDKGVSRQHLVLEYLENEVFIAEAISAEGKRPTYGTYINEQRIGTVPQPLMHGSEIRLGNRCRMRFEKLMTSASSMDDKTLDMTTGDDVTQASTDDDKTAAYHGS